MGHLAGDQLLSRSRRAACNPRVRDTDVLARLGGDEFAIIQEGGGDQREGAVALALRIIEAISDAVRSQRTGSRVGTSIGIALAPEDGVEPGELLKRADLALYNVKSSGRNDYRLFRNEMLRDRPHPAVGGTRTARRHRAGAVRAALPAGGRRQDAANSCGVEALVRWRHPTKGMIPPDHFIPLAESTGLIVPLGEWILTQACTDAANWPARHQGRRQHLGDPVQEGQSVRAHPGDAGEKRPAAGTARARDHRNLAAREPGSPPDHAPPAEESRDFDRARRFRHRLFRR